MGLEWGAGCRPDPAGDCGSRQGGNRGGWGRARPRARLKEHGLRLDRRVGLGCGRVRTFMGGSLRGAGGWEEALLRMRRPLPRSRSRRSGIWWRTCHGCCRSRAPAAPRDPRPLAAALLARGPSAPDSPAQAPPGPDPTPRIPPGRVGPESPPVDSASPAARSCSPGKYWKAWAGSPTAEPSGTRRSWSAEILFHTGGLGAESSPRV